MLHTEKKNLKQYLQHPFKFFSKLCFYLKYGQLFKHYFNAKT